MDRGRAQSAEWDLRQDALAARPARPASLGCWHSHRHAATAMHCKPCQQATKLHGNCPLTGSSRRMRGIMLVLPLLPAAWRRSTATPRAHAKERPWFLTHGSSKIPIQLLLFKAHGCSYPRVNGGRNIKQHQACVPVLAQNAVHTCPCRLQSSSAGPAVRRAHPQRTATAATEGLRQGAM